VVEAAPRRLTWSEGAQEDLRSIHKFVARDSPHYANLLVAHLIAAVDRLATFPLSGRVVPEFQQEDLREVLHGHYRIVYRLHVDAVAIVTVFHAARLLPKDLEQRQG
jgi:toxin ParE1/3/4